MKSNVLFTNLTALNTLKSRKFSSFIELENDIISLNTTKDEGDTLEYLTYFLFKYFRIKYDVKEIYMEKDIPNNIRNRYALENTDNGVDGVILHSDNTCSAYQVKFRSNRSLSYTETATFWGEAENFEHRILITNSEEISTKITKKNKSSFFSFADFCSLDSNFFEELFKFFNSSNPKSFPILYKKLKPRDYQKKLIMDIITGFKNENRGKLIAACGVGKTLIALWTQEKMAANYILYIVPSLGLIKQTLESWSMNFNVPFQFLCVCSDNSVSESSRAIKNDENIVTADFKVTNNVELIQDFLSSKTSKKKVIFTTYNSLPTVSLAIKHDSFKFDLAFFDESHRTTGIKTDGDNYYTFGLDNNYIGIKYRLFMTATERIISNKIKNLAKDNTLGNKIYSMDDVDTYGPTIAEMTFGEAISKGIINDYKIIIPVVKQRAFSQIEKLSNKFNVTLDDNNTEKKIDKKNLLKQIILAISMNDLNLNKVISYHSFVKTSKAFIKGSENSLPLSDVFNKVTEYTPNNNNYFDYVSGIMSAGLRKDKLLRMEKATGYSVISNARCLTEGIDVPSVDGIYFADSKNSEVDIVQAVGRALRKSGKINDISYIILPVIIDDDGSFKDADGYDTVMSVLKNMSNHDASLKLLINKINRSGGDSGATKAKQQKITITTPLSTEFDDFSSIIQNIHVSIANDLTKFEQNRISTDRIITKNARKTNMTTVKPLQDYNADSIHDRLIKPLMSKIYNANNKSMLSSVDGAPNSLFTGGHNNIKAATTLGIIEKSGYKHTEYGQLYKVTDIYDELSTGKLTFEELFRLRIINYDTSSELFIDGKKIYPYLLILKIIQKILCISHIELVYTLFTLKSRQPKFEDLDDLVEIMINDIFYIRDLFPNISNLNEANRRQALDILNNYFDTTATIEDIWSTRKTTYNKANYFFNHISYCFPFIRIEGRGISKKMIIAESDKITIQNGIDRLFQKVEKKNES